MRNDKAANRNRWIAGILLAVIASGLLSASPAFAQSAAGVTNKKTNSKKDDDDKKKEDEEREAAKEAENENNLSLLEQVKLQTEFHGVLDLKTENSGAVVGTLVTDATDKTPNTTYQLKLENSELLKVLLPFDKKKVAVYGKLRNNGKYLVAMSLCQHSPGPQRVERRMRGGL